MLRMGTAAVKIRLLVSFKTVFFKLYFFHIVLSEEFAVEYIKIYGTKPLLRSCRCFYFFFILFIRPPPELLPVLGPLERRCDAYT